MKRLSPLFFIALGGSSMTHAMDDRHYDVAYQQRLFESIEVLNRRAKDCQSTMARNLQTLQGAIETMPQAMVQIYEDICDRTAQTNSKIDEFFGQLNSNLHDAGRVEKLFGDISEHLCTLEQLQSQIVPLTNFVQERERDFEKAVQIAFQDDAVPARPTASDRMVHDDRPAATTPVDFDFDESISRTVHATEQAKAHLVENTVPHNLCSMSFNPTAPQANGLHGIPSSLRALPGVQVLYYPSPLMRSRASGTCVSRALGNAMAITAACNEHNLTAGNVHRKAAEHNDLNSHSAVSNIEVIDMAVGLHLANVHHMNIKSGKYYADPGIANYFLINASTELNTRSGLKSVDLYREDVFQAQVMHKIRTSENIVAHFICSVDASSPNDHGILVSVVKRHGHMPTIIYMDCNNVPVTENSKPAAFITYLYYQCIG